MRAESRTTAGLGTAAQSLTELTKWSGEPGRWRLPKEQSRGSGRVIDLGENVDDEHFTPGIPRALVSTMSRAALMRTAATALIAASPFAYSGASAATSTGNFQLTASAPQGDRTVTGPRLANQPVQNLLAVPMDARAGDATISASSFSISTMAVGPISETATGTDPINISNADAIDGGAGIAIEATGDQGSVTVANGGDISGAYGIVAGTGVMNATRRRDLLRDDQ